MVGSGARIRDQLRSDSTSRVPPTSANLSRISARPIPPARPARNCSRTFWDSFVFPKRQCLLQFPIFLAYIWRGAYGWLLATAYTVATGRADEFFIRWRENLCCRQGDILVPLRSAGVIAPTMVSNTHQRSYLIGPQQFMAPGRFNSARAFDSHIAK
jgi:hypothetical protein